MHFSTCSSSTVHLNVAANTSPQKFKRKTKLRSSVFFEPSLHWYAVRVLILPLSCVSLLFSKRYVYKTGAPNWTPEPTFLCELKSTKSDFRYGTPWILMLMRQLLCFRDDPIWTNSTEEKTSALLWKSKVCETNNFERSETSSLYSITDTISSLPRYRKEDIPDVILLLFLSSTRDSARSDATRMGDYLW